MKSIRIRDARENNLKGIDLDIPHHAVTCVTGPSGSGKSSLVYDIVCREGQRRYLDSFSSFARQYLGRLGGPEVGDVAGLMPAVAVDQRTVVRNPRSTVGTLSELHDHLRLLFARLGRSDAPLSRSTFSFNDPQGACPRCRGLGVEDRIDPELLVADPRKTLREGALAITTPSGYTIYSQVTIDVLDQVCRSEGFDVDTPWSELSEADRKVVLEGSDKIRIPYGKHPLESRLRWTGITAKPREEGHYKGILPVMESILRTSRNDNILRFARTVPCPSCDGHRLNDRARSVRLHGWSITDLLALPVRRLAGTLGAIPWSRQQAAVAEPIVANLERRCEILEALGLGYLTPTRASESLSAGEAQRIRLATQAQTPLRGVLYVLDEPSVGLHPADNRKLIERIRTLRDQGNTVVVVEHDLDTMRCAERIVDIGPGAGKHGGRVVLDAPSAKLASCEAPESRTLPLLTSKRPRTLRNRQATNRDRWLALRGVEHHNLRSVDARFLVGGLNVVTGVSGAGKSSLVIETLVPAARGRLSSGQVRELEGFEAIRKVLAVDQKPIGRSSRSNPATYTKVFDAIRKLFAAQPLAKQRGWTASRFSFNNPGGRCEACEGSGVLQTGLHFLGNVQSRCEQCHGRRFDEPTLEVRVRGASIANVLAMDVLEARTFFEDETGIRKVLDALATLGLGYLPLGQPATTVSGGEAQRIKLATELARRASSRTLIVLDEPTTGLHDDDVEHLIEALRHMAGDGNTVVVVEHHERFVRDADHVVDLGPGSGEAGGRVVHQGSPASLAACPESITGEHLRTDHDAWTPPAPLDPRVIEAPIELEGVSTHNLRDVDVAFPRNRLTVVTGVSGSGKSSLAFDTLFAEGQHRFLESFSTYARQLVGQKARPELRQARGLTPTIAVDRASATRHPRSTVGTVTGSYDLFRLLYSRVGRDASGERVALWSSHFSFNHEAGACPRCTGLGTLLTCHPDKLVSDPSRPLADGATAASKTGRYLGDPHGRHMAILHQVGRELGFDYRLPWRDLPDEARRVALHGTGDRVYEVVWRYRRKTREGQHAMRATWDGLVAYVDDEFARKHEQKRGDDVRGLMRELPCPACSGTRLRSERLQVRVADLSIGEICAISADEVLDRLTAWPDALPPGDRAVAQVVLPPLRRRLEALRDLGLGYLSADRGTTTLSGGEASRVRLAAQLGARLTGITYVLDEPTVGLHARDTGRLLRVLRELRDQGNTVVVVEHDREVIEAADHVVELGPGAGRQGGRVVYAGPARPNNGNVKWPELPVPQPGPAIRVRGARAHNLRHVDATLPLGALTVFAGVSGSGKSSLAFDVIAASFERGRPEACEAVEGRQYAGEVTRVDDTPVGSSPRSTVASYTGLLDLLRARFAATAEAKRAKLGKSHFSHLSKAGACETCQGYGQRRVAMDFLGDVWVPCPACRGRRYRDAVLEVRWNEMSIADVLDATVSELAERVQAEPKMRSVLSLIEEIGLGHMRLGQPATSLSGGESRRLRLARALIDRGDAPRVFILDEPTQGLADEDVAKLMLLFGRLLDQGHTLWVVEHHPGVIAAAHHVVELGPGAGAEGGQVVFAGSASSSATGAVSRIA